MTTRIEAIQNKIKPGFRRDERYYQPFTETEYGNAVRLGKQLESQLQLPEADREYLEHGYKSGELDEFNAWQVAAGIPSPRIFSQIDITGVPMFHFGLLVDCSGSMYYGAGGSNSRIDRARTLAMALAIAMENASKVKTTICGHTEVGSRVQLTVAKLGNTPVVRENIESLTAQSGNLDAYALYATARVMSKQMNRGDSGLIALICDGEPCHSREAMRDGMREVQGRFKISTLAIGVGSGMGPKECTELYGAGNFITVSDPLRAATPLAVKINQLAARLITV